MKIALVIDHLDPRRGGAEQWTFQHAERLLARGHEVHVVAQGVNGPAARLDIVPHLLGPIRSVLQRAAAAEAALQRLNVDMVHDIGLGWHSHVLQSEDGSRLAQWEQKLLLAALVAAAVEAGDAAGAAPLPRLPPPHGPAVRRPAADRDRRFADVRAGLPALSRRAARSGSAWSITAPTTSVSRRPIAIAGARRSAIAWAFAKMKCCCLFVGHDYQRKGLATAVRAAQPPGGRRGPGAAGRGGRKEAAAAARDRFAPTAW